MRASLRAWIFIEIVGCFFVVLSTLLGIITVPKILLYGILYVANR